MAKIKKVGRPSKYKEEYCSKLISFMAKGFSFEAFAGKISVNTDTIYEWAKKHKEFSDAKKKASAKSRLFWEEIGIDGAMGSEDFNNTAWIFNMKNRFNWRDKQDIKQEITGDLKVLVNKDGSISITDQD